MSTPGPMQSRSTHIETEYVGNCYWEDRVGLGVFSKDIFKTEPILPLGLLVIQWVCWGGCFGVSRTLSLGSGSPSTHPLQSPDLWLDLLRSVRAWLVPMGLCELHSWLHYGNS